MVRAVKSALRTFEILELFAEHRKPMTLQEIYTVLGYPQSSTTNLLKSMVAKGYINYNRNDRTYIPTTRISLLGNWVPGYIRAAGLYQEFIEELQRQTDETVALVTQNDLYIQYIILLTPAHEYKMAPSPGAMRLMVDSSSGLAMMSKMDEGQIEKIVRYTNYYGHGEGHRFELESVLSDVQAARRLGYAYVPNRPSPEVSSIAIALDQDLHGIQLAAGVGGLADRIEAKKDSIISVIRELVCEYFNAPVPSDKLRN